MEGCGSVVLIGAGPGDPGLLTLAGREALERAEVVLYDRLAAVELLELAPPEAELIDVGKQGGRHPVPQEAINALLLEHARRGRRVVRLKGGDPYLFGRGAEELEPLAAAGIPVRVIPGVSSAIAVPALAGIPVTHRDFAASLHILTGQGRDNTEPDLPFDELARLGGTLVFLMGVGALERICGGLLEAGMDPDTPAALVENGARPEQRRLDGSLGDIAPQAREAFLRPPAVLVVGAVCTLAGRLGALPAAPLYGRRILCCGRRETASRLAALLREQGASAPVYAAVRTEPLALPASLWERLRACRWITLTSAVGANRFLDELDAAGLDLRVLHGIRVAAVGPATAAALRGRGLRPDLLPEVHDGAHLARALCDRVEEGERVLLLRARDGTPALPEILEERGVCFDDIPLYRTVAQPMPEHIRRLCGEECLDLVALTSPSAAEAFADSLEGQTLPAALCIGASTAAAAGRRGMRTVVSASATVEGMAETIQKELGRNSVWN